MGTAVADKVPRRRVRPRSPPGGVEDHLGRGEAGELKVFPQLALSANPDHLEEAAPHTAGGRK